MQGGVDGLEVVELGLAVQQQERFAGQQGEQSGDGGGPAAGVGAFAEQGAGGQRQQQGRDQQERVQHEHQRQGGRGAGAGAGEVVAVDPADFAGVQHEAEGDVYAGEEEERQQAGVVERDVADLRQPGGLVLQLQGIERIDGGEMKPEGRGQDHRRGQDGQQAGAVAGEGVAEQGQHDAAEREADHDDGDDPVTVFGPFRDGEVTGEGDLVADGAGRHEEQRPEGRAAHFDGLAHGQMLPGRAMPDG